jgi:hypothetical protein
MKGPDTFVQAYDAHAVVDADSQVIVAQALSDRPTDVRLFGVRRAGAIAAAIGCASKRSSRSSVRSSKRGVSDSSCYWG